MSFVFFVQSGLTPLHVASFMGHIEIVTYLLHRGCDPNAKTVRGETSLHLATRGNQTSIMKVLLRNGAHVDAKAKVSVVCFQTVDVTLSNTQTNQPLFSAF